MPMPLPSLSIRARLIAAAGLAAGALVLVSAVGAAALSQARSAFAAFAATEFTAQARLVELRGHLGNVRRFEKDVLLNIDHLDKAKAYQARWREAVAGVRASLAQADTGADPARTRRLQALLGDYEHAAAAVLQKTLDGQIVMGTEANELLEPAKRHLHEAEPLIEAVASGIVDAAKARERAVEAAVGDRLRLIGALAVLALAVLVPVMGLTIVSVTRPLRRAVRVAESVAAGDLATPVPVQGSHEIAQLMGALAAMQASLHAIVAQVRESTASIAGASSEIAAGNHDLSQRTEQTAAELQQTTAGVGRLADDMRRTEHAARNAAADAGRATASAQQGGAVVLEVVSDMGHIAESSRRIASIVSVIDGIAFQTNLLALNAAVEAARAGTQGRGFAVVAGEVRVLARRVADAAGEIKRLIAEAAAVVDAGAGRARDAGARMQEILQSVGAVCGAMAAFSEHAVSGSTQMQGIARAVDGLDAATQRNAALVEQSAAAAAALADQVRSLDTLVGRFRLGAASAAG